MTEGRRNLHFTSFDDIMPDVARLLKGHTTVGTWSLAQICHHLTIVMKRVIDLPASTARDPKVELGEDLKRQVLDSGSLPERIPAPPLAVPADHLMSEVEQADSLRQAIDYYNASTTGPVAPHRVFGPLTKDEWTRVQLIHCAHHLSFAVPTNTAD